MKTPKLVELESILQAIYNFDSVVRHMQQVKVEAKKLKINSKSIIGGDLELYSYIKVANAYREVEVLHRYAPSNDRLAGVLYSFNPLLKFINRYKNGIISMRNGVLAHFNRDPKGQFKPYWNLFARDYLPQEPGELDFIMDSFDLLRVVLVRQFEKELHSFYESVTREIDGRFEQWREKLTARPLADKARIKTEINNRLAERGLIKPGEDYIGSFKSQ